MVISKQDEVHHSTVRKIFQVEGIKTDPNPPKSGRPSKFTPRSDCVTLREIADNPITSLKTLRATVYM